METPVLLMFSKFTALLLWIFTEGKPFSLSIHTKNGPVTKVTQVDPAELLKTQKKSYPQLDCVETYQALTSLTRKLRDATIISKVQVEGEDHERTRCLILQWNVDFATLKHLLKLDHLEIDDPTAEKVSEIPVQTEDSTSSLTHSGIDYSAVEPVILSSMLELYRRFPAEISRELMGTLGDEGLTSCNATSVPQLYDRVRNQSRGEVQRFVTYSKSNGAFLWKQDFLDFAGSGSVTQVAPTDESKTQSAETTLPESLETTESQISELMSDIAETEAELARKKFRLVELNDHRERLITEKATREEERNKAETVEQIKRLCLEKGLDLRTVAVALGA